jgi:iron complex transport system substrate-binding protein
MRRVFCEALGSALELPERCERIVSFSPAITESLFEMGLGDKVVGVSAFCVRPPEARKRVILGSYSTANLERLKALEPEIVFTTTGYQRPFAEKLSRSFPVYAMPLPSTIAALIAGCAEVGLVAGYPENARELERRLLDGLPRSRPRGSGSKRVYVEIDLGGPVTFGAYSYITDALHFVGAQNVFGEVPSEWLEPDIGKVAARDPEVIIYEPKMFRPLREADVLEKLRRRGWGDLAAVRAGRVHVTPGPYDFLAHHGPSFITQALPWLMRVLGQQGF